MCSMLHWIKTHKYALAGLYLFVFLAGFGLLELVVKEPKVIIHCPVDDWIPFCEFFIVPYMLWFPYMILAVIYFIFFNKNKHEYYQLAFNLMMGMTVFLIVSYVYPNAQHIRPTEFPRDNIFTDIVKWLYSTDTPTNILPSIHVFNSLAIHMSLTNCETLRNKKFIKAASFTLTALIIMSTMFLKQHSVIDVCMGATLALFGFLVFYPRRVSVSSESVCFREVKRNKSEN